MFSLLLKISLIASTLIISSHPDTLEQAVNGWSVTPKNDDTKEAPSKEKLQTELSVAEKRIDKLQKDVKTTNNNLNKLKTKLDTSLEKMKTLEKTLKNMKASNKKLNDAVDNLKRNPVPKGFMYSHVSGGPSARELWPQLKWEDVSEKLPEKLFPMKSSNQLTNEDSNRECIGHPEKPCKASEGQRGTAKNKGIPKDIRIYKRIG